MLRIRSATAAGLLAALALVAGACGSPANDTASTTGSSTGSTGTTATTTAPATGSTLVAGTTIAPGTSTTIATATTAKGVTTTAVTTTTAPGTDPGTLPQTEDKPTASGEQWDAGTHALWNAIVSDDPAKALPFFFPLSAYKQVKGISDPEHDYTTRLIAYYDEDIHTLHRQLGDAAATAQFVKIEVPNAAAWIKPGVEYNKGAYWRVFDSKLVYTVNGATKSFLVKSMISWRGQWYVVHLSSVR